MNRNTNVVLLTAGTIPDDLKTLFGDLPSGMIPINGKPSLSFIIDELLSHGFKKYKIAIGYKKEYIKKIISKRYGTKCDIEFIEVDFTKGPGNSLITSFEAVNSRDLLVVLGDTIFKSDLPLEQSFILTSRNFEISSRWCLVREENGFIGQLYDKVQLNGIKDCQAVIGVYYFKNFDALLKATKDVNINEKVEISELLDSYSNYEPIRVIECKEWYDVGHIDKYYYSKRMLLQSRFFNNLEFNDIIGTIKKICANREKFQHEIKWYYNLPSEISVLSPRIIKHSSEENNHLGVVMEYYGYPTLSELYVYGNLHPHIWESIIYKLINLLKLFRQYKGAVDISDYFLMYYDKTERRLEQLLQMSDEFKEIFSYHNVVLNGKNYLNWEALKPFIYDEVNKFYSEDDNCLIHGDFCFSNILYDINSGIVRLIDPRGIWGEKEMYGDMKYDVAKLRHSIVGLYDFITNDLFDVERKGNQFTLSLYSEETHRQIGCIFDEVISSMWDLRQIMLIEGLLFLSMLPFHPNHRDRQIAMYLTGIKLLNNILNSNEK